MTPARTAIINGKPVTNRMVFCDISKNTMVWDWQRSTDDGSTWTPTWLIHYERRE